MKGKRKNAVDGCSRVGQRAVGIWRGAPVEIDVCWRRLLRADAAPNRENIQSPNGSRRPLLPTGEATWLASRRAIWLASAVVAVASKPSRRQGDRSATRSASRTSGGKINRASGTVAALRSEPVQTQVAETRTVGWSFLAQFWNNLFDRSSHPSLPHGAVQVRQRMLVTALPKRTRLQACT